jgi:hypothetical protein
VISDAIDHEPAFIVSLAVPLPERADYQSYAQHSFQL